MTTHNTKYPQDKTLPDNARADNTRQQHKRAQDKTHSFWESFFDDDLGSWILFILANCTPCFAVFSDCYWVNPNPSPDPHHNLNPGPNSNPNPGSNSNPNPNPNPTHLLPHEHILSSRDKTQHDSLKTRQDKEKARDRKGEDKADIDETKIRQDTTR